MCPLPYALDPVYTKENWIVPERDRSQTGTDRSCVYTGSLGIDLLSVLVWDRFARAIQFEIDPVRASCKRLDRSQTGTDAKRGKSKKEIEAVS